MVRTGQNRLDVSRFRLVVIRHWSIVIRVGNLCLSHVEGTITLDSTKRMTLFMPQQRQSAAERLVRLEKMLSVLRAQPEFTLKHARQTLAEESPRVLRRLVRDLESDGLLYEIADATFQWVCDAEQFPARTWLEKRVYAPSLAQTPAADRPRERLLAHGAAALRTAELLAILIRTGRTGESALQAGEKIAARYAECLDGLGE